jgi:hypothetical protein
MLHEGGGIGNSMPKVHFCCLREGSVPGGPVGKIGILVVIQMAKGRGGRDQRQIDEFIDKYKYVFYYGYIRPLTRATFLIRDLTS